MKMKKDKSYLVTNLVLGVIAGTGLVALPDIANAQTPQQTLRDAYITNFFNACNNRDPRGPFPFPNAPCDPAANISARAEDPFVPGPGGRPKPLDPGEILQPDFGTNPNSPDGLPGITGIFGITPNTDPLLPGIVPGETLGIQVENINDGAPYQLNLDFAPPAQGDPGPDPSRVGNFRTTVSSNDNISADYRLLSNIQAVIKDIEAGDCPDCEIEGEPAPPPTVENFLVLDIEPRIDQGPPPVVIDPNPPVLMDSVEYERIEYDLFSIPDFAIRDDLAGGSVVTATLETIAYKVDTSGRRIEEYTRTNLPDGDGDGEFDGTETIVYVNRADIAISIAVPETPEATAALLSQAGANFPYNSVSINITSTIDTANFINQVDDVPEPSTIISLALLGGGVFGFTKRKTK